MVDARLAEAAASRGQDVASLQALLASPRVAAKVQALAADPAELGAGLASLRDAEIADLAARAAALERDPASGLSGSTDDLLVVLLIVLIVLLVLKAV